MRFGGVTKIAAAQTSISEKKGRKSLHPLQPAATDKENLVGAGRQLRSLSTSKQSIKNEMSGKMKRDVKKILDKTVVVKSDSCEKVIDKIKIDSKNVQKHEKKDGKIFKDKFIQTETIEKIKISNKDLTSKASPSSNYWEVLAERRRIALQDALEENQILSDQICVYKEMLDKSKAFIDVLKEMLSDDRNDINNSLEDSSH